MARTWIHLTGECGESATVVNSDTKPWNVKWSNNNVAYGLMNNHDRPLLETQGLGQNRERSRNYAMLSNDPNSYNTVKPHVGINNLTPYEFLTDYFKL